jgi:hypothetical protein
VTFRIPACKIGESAVGQMANFHIKESRARPANASVETCEQIVGHSYIGTLRIELSQLPVCA